MLYGSGIVGVPVIGTKPFHESWWGFIDAWHGIRHSDGGGLALVKALAGSDGYTIGFGNRNLDLVARVFRACAQYHDGQEFYTDLRTLASVAGLRGRDRSGD